MTYQEFVNWTKYANKHGPLNSQRHISMSLAYAATIFAGAFFKKSDGTRMKFDDFMLWGKEKPNNIDSPDEVFSMFQALAKGSKNNGK